MTKKPKLEWMLIVDGLPYPDIFELKEAQAVCHKLTLEGHEVHAFHSKHYFAKNNDDNRLAMELFVALRERGVNAKLKVR